MLGHGPATLECFWGWLEETLEGLGPYSPHCAESVPFLPILSLLKPVIVPPSSLFLWVQLSGITRVRFLFLLEKTWKHSADQSCLIWRPSSSLRFFFLCSLLILLTQVLVMPLEDGHAVWPQPRRVLFPVVLLIPAFPMGPTWDACVAVALSGLGISRFLASCSKNQRRTHKKQSIKGFYSEAEPKYSLDSLWESRVPPKTEFLFEAYCGV